MTYNQLQYLMMNLLKNKIELDKLNIINMTIYSMEIIYYIQKLIN